MNKPSVGLNAPVGELSLPERLSTRLQQGLSIATAAQREGISADLGQVIVDDLLRRGTLTSASSLCTSGLGACEGASSEQTRLQCAGCPLARL